MLSAISGFVNRVPRRENVLKALEAVIMDGSPDAAVVFADDDDGATKDIVDVEVDEARAEEQEADATGRLTALLGLLLLTRPLPSFVLSATSSPFVVVAAAAAASVPAAVPAAAAAATDGEEKEEREGQVEKLAKEPNEEEEKEDEEKEDEAASASIEDDVVEALEAVEGTEGFEAKLPMHSSSL